VFIRQTDENKTHSADGVYTLKRERRGRIILGGYTIYYYNIFMVVTGHRGSNGIYKTLLLYETER